MADKYQLVARGSLWGGGDATIRPHLGLLASKSGKRAIRHLLSLHPIHVVAITKVEEGKIKSWCVVAGERTYQLARGVIPADEKIPVVVLSDTNNEDYELEIIDEILSVLMFADPPEVFWGAWDKWRSSGDIRNLGRDLDDTEEVEQILGRKRKRKTKRGALDATGTAEKPPKIDSPPNDPDGFLKSLKPNC